MGRIFVVELEGRSYRCKFCGTHLAHPDQLVSKSFHSRGGKAYLFNNVVNITVGAPEERAMFSGLHIVADIFCCCCGGIIGWKYVMSDLLIMASLIPFALSHSEQEVAHELNQKYKEGKFVLERGRIVGEMDLSAELFIDTHHE